ncbi:bifunctional demethylmenaquinone methyltransferase/2-methoxy-6-polyprenyl-1,4-benzoquinol methylase UbiE [Planctomycetota bacterium]
MEKDIDPDKKDSQTIARMFSRIVPTYDTVNHILSLGLDFYWRRRAVRCLDLVPEDSVLDVAVGTGDLLIRTFKTFPTITRAVGVDLSEEMLARCREKLARRDLLERVELQNADAQDLSFADATFQAVTMGFGIRNTAHPERVLQEIIRVLKPGGDTVILEFALPRRAWLRAGYLAYLRTIVPWVGGILSRQGRAYRYLNRSIESFVPSGQFVTLLQTVGFVRIQSIPLCVGGVRVYHATKAGIPAQG